MTGRDWKEYRRVRSLAAYHARRQELLTAVGGSCSRCQGQGHLVLTWVDGDAAAGELGLSSVKGLYTCSQAVVDKAMAGGLVAAVCRACVSADRPWQHGTWYAAYKKKCRCSDCGEFAADYALRRREDRRAKREEKRT